VSQLSNDPLSALSRITQRGCKKRRRAEGGVKLTQANADALGGYPFRTHKTCFPAKAGIQTGLPPSRENREGMVSCERRLVVVRGIWEPMVSRIDLGPIAKKAAVFPPRPVRSITNSGTLTGRGSSAFCGCGLDASTCATPSPRSGGCARGSR
jgi:hypothetical protein